jgi:hypothetical protein
MLPVQLERLGRKVAPAPAAIPERFCFDVDPIYDSKGFLIFLA